MSSLTINYRLNIKGQSKLITRHGKVVVFLEKLWYKNAIEHSLLFITLNISNLCAGRTLQLSNICYPSFIYLHMWEGLQCSKHMNKKNQKNTFTLSYIYICTRNMNLSGRNIMHCTVCTHFGSRSSPCMLKSPLWCLWVTPPLVSCFCNQVTKELCN